MVRQLQQTILFQIEVQMNYQANDCCAICNQQPQDMLILVCNHNICLDCATELFTANNNQQSLQCEICTQHTPLDQETINCLISLSRKHHRASPILFPVVQPHLPKPPKEIKGIYCKQHNEKAQYYCFDCSIANICSECILLQAHHNHKIMTLKKASKSLLSKLVDYLQQMGEQKERLVEENEAGVRRKEECIASYEQKQNKLKTLFDDIMRQSACRYGELNQQLESISRRSIEMVEGYLVSLADKIDSIETVIDETKSIMKLQDPEVILMKYNSLQLNRSQFTSPLQMLKSQLSLEGQSNCIIQIQNILSKITWQQISLLNSQERVYKVQMNKVGVDNEGSFMQYDKHWAKGYVEDDFSNELREKNANISLNKYSGIKNSSRKLQLSRSMDNATNIINKLQQRIRK